MPHLISFCCCIIFSLYFVFAWFFFFFIRCLVCDASSPSTNSSMCISLFFFSQEITEIDDARGHFWSTIDGHALHRNSLFLLHILRFEIFNEFRIQSTECTSNKQKKKNIVFHHHWLAIVCCWRIQMVAFRDFAISFCCYCIASVFRYALLCSILLFAPPNKYIFVVSFIVHMQVIHCHSPFSFRFALQKMHRNSHKKNRCAMKQLHFNSILHTNWILYVRTGEQNGEISNEILICM